MRLDVVIAHGPRVARLGALALLLVAGLASAHAQTAPDEPSAGAARPARSVPPIDVTPPRVALSGLEATVTLATRGYLGVAETPFEIHDVTGSVVARGTLESNAPAVAKFAVRPEQRPYSVLLPELYADGVAIDLHVLPGWLSLLPPLFAIALALLFRQVVPALVAGVWVGAWTVAGDPLAGLLRTVDRYAIDALTDRSKASIVVFSLLLGGMVGIMARTGGTLGLVEALRPWATDTRRGQLVTWLMGILIFFDDYANTLLVGNTMRPITDRLRISREKLAYIVDSTAAPVAAIGLISTWIGYEVGLIASALAAVGSERDAYTVFLQSIPYNFYPILALVFGLMVAAARRDFGPMLRAERRARAGQLLADSAVPLSDFDGEALQPPAGKPRRWINAVIPVVVVLAITFLGLWISGRAALVGQGEPAGSARLSELGLQGLGSVFGAGDSLQALLWASFSGCLVALALAAAQRVLTVGQALEAWLQGMRSMLVAIVILVLAWGIAAVCTDLNTSGFMVASLSNVLDARLLPAIVFVLAALTAFATGTSWGTMGILLPLAVPTALGVAQAAGLSADASEPVLLGAIASVLAGAIFGDHCSPISDTTVMSSMASGCDHVDHVRTQLPYALLVAGVALVTGYLPEALGLPAPLCLLLGTGVLAGTLYLFGSTPERVR